MTRSAFACRECGEDLTGVLAERAESEIPFATGAEMTSAECGLPPSVAR